MDFGTGLLLSGCLGAAFVLFAPRISTVFAFPAPRTGTARDAAASSGRATFQFIFAVSLAGADAPVVVAESPPPLGSARILGRQWAAKVCAMRPTSLNSQCVFSHSFVSCA